MYIVSVCKKTELKIGHECSLQLLSFGLAGHPHPQRYTGRIAGSG